MFLFFFFQENPRRIWSLSSAEGLRLRRGLTPFAGILAASLQLELMSLVLSKYCRFYPMDWVHSCSPKWGTSNRIQSHTHGKALKFTGDIEPPLKIKKNKIMKHPKKKKETWNIPYKYFLIFLAFQSHNNPQTTFKKTKTQTFSPLVFLGIPSAKTAPNLSRSSSVPGPAWRGVGHLQTSWKSSPTASETEGTRRFGGCHRVAVSRGFTCCFGFFVG